MKNYKLWLVVSLLLIGGGVTFFILWYKEKNKQSQLNLRTNNTVPFKKPATAEEAGAEVAVNTTVSEVDVSDTARTVVMKTPSSFGQRA